MLDHFLTEIACISELDNHIISGVLVTLGLLLHIRQNDYVQYMLCEHDNVC